MNPLTAVENPFYVGEMRSPTNHPKNDVGALIDIGRIPVLPGWLGRITDNSYEAWLMRGGVEASV